MSIVVGQIPYPAAVGAANAPIADPIEMGMIAFCGHVLKSALDPYLATQDAPGIRDAAPLENRFTQSPRDIYIGRKAPALFVYWSGTTSTDRLSIIQDVQYRTFTFQWMFERIGGLEGVNQYSGLLAHANAALQIGFSNYGEDAFALGSYAAGSDLREMLNIVGLSFKCTSGFLKELPAASLRSQGTTVAATRAAEGGIQYGYPALQGTITTAEIIGLRGTSVPFTQPGNGQLTISNEGVPVLYRFIPIP